MEICIHENTILSSVASSRLVIWERSALSTTKQLNELNIRLISSNLLLMTFPSLNIALWECKRLQHGRLENYKAEASFKFVELTVYATFEVTSGGFNEVNK